MVSVQEVGPQTHQWPLDLLDELHDENIDVELVPSLYFVNFLWRVLERFFLSLGGQIWHFTRLCRGGEPLLSLGVLSVTDVIKAQL